MAQIYSTAFIQSAGGVGGSYTVPSGYTAVIRCITFTNANAGVSTTTLHFTSPLTNIVRANVPGAGTTPLGDSGVVYDVRVVAYSGQTFAGGGSPGIDMTVSGYLFGN